MVDRIRSYRDLFVRQQGMDVAESIYVMTRSWPRNEQFGSSSQTRRAAVSIPADIAEGYGRETRGSYVNFLRIAQGSLKELETHLIPAGRIGLTKTALIDALLSQSDELGRMLRALIRSLIPKT